MGSIVIRRSQILGAYLYERCFFLLDLSTISRSESLTSSYDKYVHAETSMREFIEQYKMIVEDRYEKDAKAGFECPS
jgi:hypothetical protein